MCLLKDGIVTCDIAHTNDNIVTAIDKHTHSITILAGKRHNISTCRNCGYAN